MATSLGFPTPADSDKMRYTMQRIRELAAAVNTYLERTTAGVTYGTNWGDLNEGTQVDKRGGIVTVYIAANKAAAVGANETILTLPAGYRPRRAVRGLCNNTGAGRPVTISTAGVVSMDVAQAAGQAALVGSVTFPI